MSTIAYDRDHDYITIPFTNFYENRKYFEGNILKSPVWTG